MKSLRSLCSWLCLGLLELSVTDDPETLGKEEVFRVSEVEEMGATGGGGGNGVDAERDEVDVVDSDEGTDDTEANGGGETLGIEEETIGPALVVGCCICWNKIKKRTNVFTSTY